MAEGTAAGGDTRPAASVAVLGCGAWGLTLGNLIAQNGYAVRGWDRSEAMLETIRTSKTHPKLPGLELSPNLTLSSSIEESIAGADLLLTAVPTGALRVVWRQAAALCHDRGVAVICCTKGIEEETLRFPSSIFYETFGAIEAKADFCVLTGPSHAEEVCRRMPTSVVAASIVPELAAKVSAMFRTPYFRVYAGDDVTGCEVGGALKNVIAVAAGACDGLNYGDNSKAALITRGLAEIARLGDALGAQPLTLSGLAGLGDLVVTTISKHSRNRRFGQLVAEGLTPEQALEAVGATVEGYRTSHSAFQLAGKLGLDMPITSAVHAVLHEGRSVQEMVAMLMQRAPKSELG